MVFLWFSYGSPEGKNACWIPGPYDAPGTAAQLVNDTMGGNPAAWHKLKQPIDVGLL